MIQQVQYFMYILRLGLTISAYHVVIVDIVGIDKVAQALGVVNAMVSVTALVGPFLGGKN